MLICTEGSAGIVMLFMFVCCECCEVRTSYCFLPVFFVVFEQKGAKCAGNVTVCEKSKQQRVLLLEFF
jgi:hypothetical protein